MMSSSELQRISLATCKVVYPEGTVVLEPLQAIEPAENDNADQESIKENGDEDAEVPTATKRTITVTSTTNSSKTNEDHAPGLTNGVADGNSPNRANETITSSMGDITVDSVRDHLNTTTTTLCSTTTEETVGKLKCDNLFVSLICVGLFHFNVCSHAHFHIFESCFFEWIFHFHNIALDLSTK